MKINVRVRGEWILIPYKDEHTVAWLGDECLARYRTLKRYDDDDGVCEIRKTRGGLLLFPEDQLRDVLDENDFVHVVLKSDVTNRTHSTTIGNGVGISPSSQILNFGYVDNRELSTTAWERVAKAREVVDRILKENKVVYGINTGFGKLAGVAIEPDKLRELQENMVRSHCVGVSRPLSPEHTRKLLALRINILSKGFSGISVQNLEKLIAAFNASCLSVVPCKGTVGASGDLAPLSHLALGLMGEGKMWSPNTGYADAKDVLTAHGLTPIKLLPKEGIALINGTQLITSLGAEAVERSYAIARQADVVAAFTLEVLKGTGTAFESCIHRARPHKGQMLVARRFQSLLHSEVHPSEISISHRFCDRVQDSYTLRCCPQVHGVVWDTIEFVNGILTTEMNSATDNPLVFSDQNKILSGGNFHGEYPAKVLDYLAIGIHELASISERRIERLVNPHLSGLPAFLTKEPGVNSGFMIAHCTAAALVSENKVLTHPSSVDSLSTSAAQEDHVSMGGFAARKCLKVVEHVEQVLAIELMCACQGIEFLRPLTSTKPLEVIHKLVRSVVPPLERDRQLSTDIEDITDLLQESKVWEAVKPYMDIYEAEQRKELKF